MCKFTIMYQYCPEVKNYFYRKKGKAYGNGADLVFLQKKFVQDNNGKTIPVYAFRLKGSIFSYLWHKKHVNKHAAVLYGWN